jgi:hypothetical protein
MRECVIFPLLRPEGVEVNDKKVKKIGDIKWQ